MLTPDIVQKARRIELASRRLVDQLLAGQYQSVFKGRGLVFSDVRPYLPGDDVRAIDWNVSARMNVAHVKQFIEERDRTLQVIVDVSGSGAIGSGLVAKRELAAELAAVLALTAIHANDRVGLLLVTDKVERHLRAKKGRRHVMRLISEVLAYQPTARGTDLAAALEAFGRTTHERAIVFLLSDFLTPGWDRALRVCALRHEVVPIVIADALDAALPALGVIEVEDAETGERVELDTTAAAAAFARDVAAARARRDAAFRAIGAEPIEVRAGTPYLTTLIDTFALRAKRVRRG